MFGTYPTEQNAFLGAPHAGLSHEFENVEDGYGFLIEGAQYTPGLTGSALPWTSAAEHKEMMTLVPNGASFITLLRDRGHGRVTVDAAGEAVPWYDLTDELDQRIMRLSFEKLARLHHAAGAVQIASLAAGLPMWRFGDDLEAFIEGLKAKEVPVLRGPVSRWGARGQAMSVYFLDPDGNEIEVRCY